MTTQTTALTVSQSAIDLYTCATCAAYFHGGHNSEGVREHRKQHVARIVAGLRTVWETKDRERFFRCTQKATRLMPNHCTTGNLFSCAMTLVYGPTGMHKAWLGSCGLPTAEALALPAVQRSMTRAESRITALLDTLECDAAREVNRP